MIFFFWNTVFFKVFNSLLDCPIRYTIWSARYPIKILYLLKSLLFLQSTPSYELRHLASRVLSSIVRFSIYRPVLKLFTEHISFVQSKWGNQTRKVILKGISITNKAFLKQWLEIKRNLSLKSLTALWFSQFLR